MTIRRQFHDNGVLWAEGEFLDGNVRHGIHRQWHRNGTLAMEIPYNQGMIDGTVRQWNETGELMTESVVENGTGIWRLWSPDPNRFSEITYVNGRRNGRGRCFSGDGAVTSQTYMIDDRPVSREDYVLACESNPQLPRYEEDEFDRRFKSLVHGKRSVKVPTAKQEDEFPMKLLRGPKVREALGWLQECSSPLRTLGESTSQGDSIALVQRFYSLGAVSVHAVEIHGDRGEFQNSGRLIIELPQEAARRKQLFQACGEIAEDMGFDPDSDIGQKYIFVMLD